MSKSTAIKLISPSFEIMLQAALFDSERGVKAFAKWQTVVDFDDLSTDSYYLIPKLYLNQRNNPEDQSILKKLKGVYRRTWLENQVRIPFILEVFKLFDENRIDFLVLSQTPFVWNLLNDTGIFSLDNFDLLIGANQILEADKLLRQTGWQTTQNPAKDHSIFYKNKDSVQIILRSVQGDNYESIWENMLKTDFCSVKIKGLSLDEQILSLCDPVFGNDNNELWAFYFYLIFSTEIVSINWENLIDRAQRRRLCHGLFLKLQYVRQVFAVDIPTEKLKKLQKKAKLEIASPGKWRTAVKAYQDLRKSYRDNGTSSGLFGFIDFLREHWQVNSVLFVPWQIGKRFFRIKGNLSGQE